MRLHRIMARDPLRSRRKVMRLVLFAAASHSQRLICHRHIVLLAEKPCRLRGCNFSRRKILWKVCSSYFVDTPLHLLQNLSTPVNVEYCSLNSSFVSRSLCVIVAFPSCGRSNWYWKGWRFALVCRSEMGQSSLANTFHSLSRQVNCCFGTSVKCLAGQDWVTVVTGSFQFYRNLHPVCVYWYY